MRTMTLLSAWVFTVLIAGAAEIHVSPLGNDEHPGTSDQPLQSLEAARRVARKAAGIGGRPSTIILGEGIYVRSTSFELDGRDCNTTYQAAPGSSVRIMGGHRLPASSFTPVTDSAVLERLPVKVRDHVLQADLEALGIDAFSPLKYSGHLLPWVTAHSELYCNGEPMTLARYPNDGPTRTGAAVNPGTRVRSYQVFVPAQFCTGFDHRLRRLPPWIGFIKLKRRQALQAVTTLHAGFEPNGVRREFRFGAQEQGQRSRADIRVGDRQNIGRKALPGEAMVVSPGSQLRIDIAVAERIRIWRRMGIFVGCPLARRRSPHSDHQTFMVPPVAEMLSGAPPVLFPHHHAASNREKTLRERTLIVT